MALYVSTFDGKKLHSPTQANILVRNFQFKETRRVNGKVKARFIAWIGVLWFDKRRKDWVTASLNKLRDQSREVIKKVVADYPEFHMTEEQLASKLRDKIAKDTDVLRNRFKKESALPPELDW